MDERNRRTRNRRRMQEESKVRMVMKRRSYDGDWYLSQVYREDANMASFLYTG